MSLGAHVMHEVILRVIFKTKYYEINKYDVHNFYLLHLAVFIYFYIV